MSASDSAHHQPNSAPIRICSIPALAAALRVTDRRVEPRTSTLEFAANRLVPMYEIRTGTVREEAATAAHIITNISERLRRMGNAYGEWNTFDGAAYFDLLAGQYDWLVKITERVSTVYIVFHVDLLLPSFRTAELFWAEHFYPAYHAAHLTDPQQATTNADFADFFETVQPKMVAHWTRLTDVAHQARRILLDDIGYMTTNGSQDERLRYRAAWQHRTAANTDSALHTVLSQTPTLTLSFEFSLPAHRQPERLQRLRRNRERTLNGTSLKRIRR